MKTLRIAILAALLSLPTAQAQITVSPSSGQTAAQVQALIDSNFADSPAFTTPDIGAATGDSLSLAFSLTIPVTSSSTEGVIFKGANRYLHNFNGVGVQDGFNVFMGKNAGNFTMSPGGGESSLASQNVGIGEESLMSVTTGYRNVAVGFRTMQNTTTGFHNTAVGNAVLTLNTTGIYNTGIGVGALCYNTTGSQNQGLGSDTLFTNVDGYNNTAAGRNGMFYNVSGHNNAAYGFDCLKNSLSNYNAAFGANALLDQTTGDNNTAIGYNTGRGITTGSGNTIIGSGVTGLSAGLTNTVILANGAGTQRLYINSAGVSTFSIAPIDSTTVVAQYLINGGVGNNAGTALRMGYEESTGSTAGISGYYIGSSTMVVALDAGATRVLTGSSNGAVTFPGGNVGVGAMTTPLAKFEVSVAGNYQDGTGAASLAISDPSVITKKLYLGYDANVGANGSGYIQAINDTVAVTPLLLNPSGGPVIVGTAINNTSLLQVAGTTSLGVNAIPIKDVRHGITDAMTAGVVTVTDTGCTANTRYFFTVHTIGTVAIPSTYYATTRTASTSFVVTASVLTDTSTLDWMAIEP